MARTLTVTMQCEDWHIAAFKGAYEQKMAAKRLEDLGVVYEEFPNRTVIGDMTQEQFLLFLAPYDRLIERCIMPGMFEITQVSEIEEAQLLADVSENPIHNKHIAL